MQATHASTMYSMPHYRLFDDMLVIYHHMITAVMLAVCDIQWREFMIAAVHIHGTCKPTEMLHALC